MGEASSKGTLVCKIYDKGHGRVGVEVADKTTGNDRLARMLLALSGNLIQLMAMDAQKMYDMLHEGQSLIVASDGQHRYIKDALRDPLNVVPPPDVGNEN